MTIPSSLLREGDNNAMNLPNSRPQHHDVSSTPASNFPATYERSEAANALYVDNDSSRFPIVPQQDEVACHSRSTINDNTNNGPLYTELDDERRRSIIHRCVQPQRATYYGNVQLCTSEIVHQPSRLVTPAYPETAVSNYSRTSFESCEIKSKGESNNKIRGNDNNKEIPTLSRSSDTSTTEEKRIHNMAEVDKSDSTTPSRRNLNSTNSGPAALDSEAMKYSPTLSSASSNYHSESGILVASNNSHSAEAENESQESNEAATAKDVHIDDERFDASKDVLEIGDVVRVLERTMHIKLENGRQLKPRPSGLAKVTRVYLAPEPMPTIMRNDDELQRDNDRSTTPIVEFCYDLEWLIGGRLSRIYRDEVKFTSMEREGLLNDMTDRTKTRKRRQKGPAPSKPSPKKKKAQSTKLKSKRKHKSGSSLKATCIKSKSNPLSTTQIAEKEHLDAENGPDNGPTKENDIFDKQWKDFERILDKLERVDPFAFFLGEVPSSYQETTLTNAASNEITSHSNPSLQNNAAASPQEIASGTDAAMSQDKAFMSSIPQESKFQTRDTNVLPPPFNFTVVRQRLANGRYTKRRALDELKQRREIDETLEETLDLFKEEDLLNSIEQQLKYPKRIDWETFYNDINGMCEAAKRRDAFFSEKTGLVGKPGSLSNAAYKIQQYLQPIYDRTRKQHPEELLQEELKHRYTYLSLGNKEAAVQNDWQRNAFDERVYELFTEHTCIKEMICGGLNDEDRANAEHELLTELDDCFVGQPYTYDDTGGESEQWMKSVGQEVDKDALQKEKTKARAKKAAKTRKKRKTSSETRSDTNPSTKDEPNCGNNENITSHVSPTGVSAPGPEEGRNSDANTKSISHVKNSELELRMATDDGVIRAQVTSVIQTLLVGVQAKCMTDLGVLHKPELVSVKRSEMPTNQEDTAINSKGMVFPWAEPKSKCVHLDEEAMTTGNVASTCAKSNIFSGTTHEEFEVSPSVASILAGISNTLDEDYNLAESSPKAKPRQPPDADLAETEVWGLDCFTRCNVVRCLVEAFGSTRTEIFVEKWLLPAINACPSPLAHDMINATLLLEGKDLQQFAVKPKRKVTGSKKKCQGKSIAKGTCRGDPQDKTLLDDNDETDHQTSSQTNVLTITAQAMMDKVAKGPKWVKLAAGHLRRVILAIDTNLKNYDDGVPIQRELFRIHPKGHGAVALKPEGVPPNTLVTHYRGEIYPAWRWGEKLDAIEITQSRLKLRPQLADFYNMALERPKYDPRGYGLLFVDASRRSGFASALSHSCSPSCEVRVVAQDGKLSLALCTLRHVEQGEELTFDYNAVTESLNEYMSAVCLCGNTNCRGSFLHFATADCYQHVLERNAPVAVRLSNLIKAAMKKKLSTEDENILHKHGFGTAAFGTISFRSDVNSSSSDHITDSMDNVPVWLKRFVADTLRYIEYERRALPVALLCNHYLTSKDKLLCDEDATLEAGTDKKSGELELETDNEPTSRDTKRGKRKNGAKTEKQKKRLSNEVESKDIPKTILLPNGKQHSIQKSIPFAQPMKSFFFFGNTKKAELVEQAKLQQQQQKEQDSNGIDSKEKGTSYQSDGIFGVQHIVQRLASEMWSKLSTHEKQSWKVAAEKDWEEKGGLELAALERQRLDLLDELKLQEAAEKELEEEEKQRRKEETKKNKTAKAKKRKLDKEHKKWKELDNAEDKKSCPGSKREKEEEPKPTISFSEADAEGVCAMEQRIQSLAQTLSRVGRVLWKHRERSRKDLLRTAADASTNDNLISNVSTLHSPIAMMTDKEIIDFLWQSSKGPVQQLMLFVNSDESNFLTFSMKNRLTKIVQEEHKGLTEFCLSPNDTGCPLSSWRSQVKQALLEIRSCLLTDDLLVDAHKTAPKSGKKKSISNLAKKNMAKDACVALADVMLLYASTTTFLKLQPYDSFNSTPINVYARELGNQVPVSLVEDAKEYETPKTIFLPPPCLPKRQPSDERNTGPGAGMARLGEKPLLTSSSDGNKGKTNEACPEDARSDNVPNASLPDGIAKPKTQTSESTKQAKGGNVLVLAESLAPLASSMEAKVIHEKGANASSSLTVETVTGTAQTANDDIDRIETTLESAPTNTALNQENQSACSTFNENSKVQTKRGSRQSKKKRTKFDESVDFCRPEDAVTSVVRQYEGEYVFSQLLQWFNGGIGTKRGLPNLLGCAVLPSVAHVKFSFFQESSGNGNKGKIKNAISYIEKMRPLLTDWLKDSISMSTPWEGALKDLFGATEEQQVTVACNEIIIGSPVLDWLVTGDPSSLQLLRSGLSQTHSDHGAVEDNTAAKNGGRKKHQKKNQGKNAADRLQLHMDNNMQAPMQALSNWVQCESPTCLKWRKLPWHVDLDHDLPSKFFCKDNVWNEAANSCDCPEDDWNEEEEVTQNFQMGDSITETDLVVGARFDVYRDSSKKYLPATVIETDFKTKNAHDEQNKLVSRVKFHFSHFKKESDEWIEVGSSKIAPFHSYVAASTEEKLKVAAKSKNSNKTTQSTKKTGKRKRRKKADENNTAICVEAVTLETSEEKAKESCSTEEERPKKTAKIQGSDSSSNETVCNIGKEVTANVKLPIPQEPDSIPSNFTKAVGYDSSLSTHRPMTSANPLPHYHASHSQTTLMGSMPEFVTSMPTKETWKTAQTPLYQAFGFSKITSLPPTGAPFASKRIQCFSTEVPSSPISSKVKTKAASPFKKKLLSRAKVEFNEAETHDLQNQQQYWLPP